MLKKTALICLIMTTAVSLFAYNIRQLSSREGLSNSAIISMCQDSDGFMWFGATDGLNTYDGLKIKMYKSLIETEKNSLSGNLIDAIMEAEPGVLWVGTNFGFNRLDKNTRKIEYYKQFEGKYLFSKSTENKVFVIHEDNQIEYYNKEAKTFVPFRHEGLRIDQVMQFFIDKADVLWIFYYDGSITNTQLEWDASGKLSFRKLNNFSHTPTILHCFYRDGKAMLIDSQDCFFELDPASRQISFIKRLNKEIAERGRISDIIRDGEDFIISFQTNGLIRLKHTPEKEIKYETEGIDIHCGVLSLWKDKRQNTIWLGTDGQGVFMVFQDDFSIRSNTLHNFPYRIQKPIRALYRDHLNNLWVGTRDDGILVFKNYQTDKALNEHSSQLITTNSNRQLINNSNYVFEPGRNDILWIGGDGPGLNYYSYKENSIKSLLSDKEQEMVHIHAVCEINDSLLWVATGGNGFFKVVIDRQGNNLKTKEVKAFRFSKKDRLNNYFFSICQENDSIIWLGNRKNGCLRMNVFTEQYTNYSFFSNESETINDILCIHRDRNGQLWFGSNYGLIRLDSYDKDSTVIKNYNENHGLINNTIHSIQEGKNGNLWLSTNRGIVEFNPRQETFKNYNHNNGLEIVEFCDGASYGDFDKRYLLFGGVNGFVCIKEMDEKSDSSQTNSFQSDIFFTGFKIYEKEYNLFDLMKRKKGKEYLQLTYDQNFFSVSFIALDYINGQNLRYLYNLENFSNKWIDNGNSNSVTFTNISPGEYTLHVRYKNSATDLWGEVYSMPIIILPPWYQTAWAYTIYVLLAIACVSFSVRFAIIRYKQKKDSMIDKMNQQQKEEIYESKLRFFTNITHELSTPLTLIYGPCERILSHVDTDNYIKRYASLIMRNAERLNSLIQELIDFRRIETGHKTCNVESVNIAELSKNIAESFAEFSETKDIRFDLRTDDTKEWNTDKSCYTKILINLLSNAFKYTPDSGRVELAIDSSESSLYIRVSNTGKGIKKEDIPLIFDRYKILENFDKQPQQGLFSRNGLGLAICHSMVKLLGGKIQVDSTPDVLTEFLVELPYLEKTSADSSEESETPRLIHPITQHSDVSFIEDENYSFNRSRPTIMIIDDDPEMLWFVSCIFKEQYNIIPVDKPDFVFELLNQSQPNLIISDIMMPGLDGITLTRMIKADKQSAHIPLILLSAKNTPEEQIEGIEAGAELYLTKPFNVEYLKSIVDRMIVRQDNLKEYYHSIVSAFELTDGQFVHKDDKTFFNNVLKTIEKNVADSNFSKEKLAVELGISSRHLYRKLKTITHISPSDLIVEYRLTLAEKLLISTKLTIEEIMYKTGFISRSTFYRGFARKFNMTPMNYRIEQEKTCKKTGKGKE